jgi:6,7-dimethyl-8-ribityllumazine synthase
MILIITAQFNERVTHALQQSALEVLTKEQQEYLVVEVPGAIEIPIAAQKFIQRLNPKAVIALGCIIKGQTDHYDWCIDSCRDGLTTLSLQESIPIIHGILAVHDPDHAWNRRHHGADYAHTALEMIKLFEQ